MRALDLHFFRADRQRIGAGEREPVDPGVGVEELPLARFEQAFGPERRAQDAENGGKLLRGKDIDIHIKSSVVCGLYAGTASQRGDFSGRGAGFTRTCCVSFEITMEVVGFGTSTTRRRCPESWEGSPCTCRGSNTCPSRRRGGLPCRRSARR